MRVGRKMRKANGKRKKRGPRKKMTGLSESGAVFKPLPLSVNPLFHLADRA